MKQPVEEEGGQTAAAITVHLVRWPGLIGPAARILQEDPPRSSITAPVALAVLHRSTLLHLLLSFLGLPHLLMLSVLVVLLLSVFLVLPFFHARVHKHGKNATFITRDTSHFERWLAK